MLFALKVPYLVPILVGLGGALVSVVPVSCGIVIYYILQYVRSNAAPLTNGDALDITHRYVQMLNGILLKWHEKGLHRMEQIQSADRKTAVGRTDTAFTPGESEMQAIAAMKRKREAKKEE